MTNFTEKQLNTKWTNKIKNCNKRNIEMKLTKEEFCFLYNSNDLICDYTGVQMSTDHTSDNYISLERIDALLPYELGNICFITKAVNQIKGSMFDQYEHGNTLAGVKLKGKYREAFFKLLKVMEDHEYIQLLKEKYSKENVYKLMKGEQTLSNETTTSNVTGFKNEEISIAQSYADFGKQIEQLGMEFSVTFLQYKALYSRKLCMLTKRPLVDKSIFVLDKTKNTITKDNLFVTNKDLQEGLDTMCAKCKLSLKEIKTLGKVLSK